MGLLDNKVVIITGAASGMGEAQARLFSKEGARLALIYHNKPLNELEASLEGDTMSMKVDVSDKHEVDHFIEAVLDKYGTIDVVSNTGGIFDGYKPLDQTEEDLFDRVLAVNAKGVYNMMKAALPVMLKNGHGTFINVASVASFNGSGGGFAYTASKSAVIGMTRSVATSYKTKGIRANAICPGLVETPMVSDLMQDKNVIENINRVSGRVGNVDDIAQTALFLASDASSYINGVAIPVDGGMLAE